LVPDKDVLHLLLLEQFVVDVEHRAAGITEDVLDAFFLEAADHDFRAHELHGHAFVKNGGLSRACPRARASAQHSGAHGMDAPARAFPGKKPPSRNTRRTPGGSPPTLVAS